jgi:hypothetical protein
VLTADSPNASSPFKPPVANVTFSNFENVYLYTAGKLWLAYGIGICCTLVAVIAGLASVFANGASYSNNFSTVMRVTHGASINTSIGAADMQGEDPLPAHLAAATVSINNGTPSRKHYGNVEYVQLEEPPFSDSQYQKALLSTSLR